MYVSRQLSCLGSEPRSGLTDCLRRVACACMCKSEFGSKTKGCPGGGVGIHVSGDGCCRVITLPKVKMLFEVGLSLAIDSFTVTPPAWDIAACQAYHSAP